MKTVFLFNPFHSIHRQHNKIITVLIDQILFEIFKLKKKTFIIMIATKMEMNFPYETIFQWSIQSNDQCNPMINSIIKKIEFEYNRIKIMLTTFGTRNCCIQCKIAQKLHQLYNFRIKNLLKLPGSLQFQRFFFPNKIMCTKETYKNTSPNEPDVRKSSHIHGFMVQCSMNLWKIHWIARTISNIHTKCIASLFGIWKKKSSSSNSAQCSNQCGFRVPLVGSNTENYQVAHKRWRESLT